MRTSGDVPTQPPRHRPGPGGDAAMTEIRGARTLADRMTRAARTWLAGLDHEQVAQAAWPWEPDGERLRWFYTPTDHGGLPLRDMRPAQQSLAMQLVATGPSRAGYVTVST